LAGHEKQPHFKCLDINRQRSVSHEWKYCLPPFLDPESRKDMPFICLRIPAFAKTTAVNHFQGKHTFPVE
jgi:hypothetical protein